MTYSLPFEAPWSVPSLTSQQKDQLDQILSQKFFYIGKGAQCYAFASEDQQYVLKFFKFKHLKPNLLIELLPPFGPLKDFREKNRERKKRKLMGVFNGYDLAFREHRHESGLIYLHLLTTKDLNLQANVVDKIGFERQINLDDVVFLIQRKGETLRSRLSRLLRQGLIREAKEDISSILTMYILEYHKGIVDHDHGVMQNTGFIQGMPFHLDIGKLNKEDNIKDREVYKLDFQHVIWKINYWIKTNYPEYYLEFTHFLEREYQRFIGESFDLETIDPKRFKKRR